MALNLSARLPKSLHAVFGDSKRIDLLAVKLAPLIIQEATRAANDNGKGAALLYRAHFKTDCTFVDALGVALKEKGSVLPKVDFYGTDDARLKDRLGAVEGKTIFWVEPWIRSCVQLANIYKYCTENGKRLEALVMLKAGPKLPKLREEDRMHPGALGSAKFRRQVVRTLQRVEVYRYFPDYFAPGFTGEQGALFEE